MQHAVCRLQYVHGCRRDTEDGEDGHETRDGGILLERTDEDVAFGDEPAEPRQSEAGKTGDDESYTEERELAHDAAHLRDVAGVRAFVNHADRGEEQPGQEAVRNHLEASTAKAHWRKRREAKEDESQVADGTVGGDVLEVLVADGDEGAKHHVENQESDDIGKPELGCFGHEEHGDAQASVSTHLHHDACREHGNCCRGCGVTVRAPEMEREQGTRNGESHEHEGECPHLEIHRERNSRERGDVPRVEPGLEVNPEQGRENHRGTECERQGKLFTAVVLLAGTVSGNHQVHADGFHLVEREEQDEVDAHEHAVDAGRENLDEGEEDFLVAPDVPADEHACPDDCGCEEQQQDVQAVGTDGVVCVDAA